jgi:hypothetical protein
MVDSFNTDFIAHIFIHNMGSVEIIEGIEKNPQ